IIATDAQMQLFKPVFDATESIPAKDADVNEISVEKIMVDEPELLPGLDIRSTALRERTSGLVIGIERNNERILNPDSSLKLAWGDIVWIVGNKKKIHKMIHDKQLKDASVADEIIPKI